MATTDIIVRVMIFALAGWIATSYRIAHSSLAAHWRKRLIVPLWFAWMAFGLGGPVYTGAITLTDALSTGASFTVGMSVYLLMYTLRKRTGSR
jgi:hypothetical protein